MPIMEEEVVVEKRPVAKEEIVIRKHATEATENVEGDVRRERVDIDQQGKDVKGHMERGAQGQPPGNEPRPR
jgi:stress response protein YsnF